MIDARGALLRTVYLMVRCSAGIASAGYAIQPSAAEIPVAPTITVTATRLPESEAPVSQSLILLESRDLRQRSAATLPEVLRNTATLYADRPGAAGGFGSLYLRGADPSHTVILVDGVKVSDPTNARGGGIDLSLIDPQTIERIEIMPGASSALYGADAMAGVVNIITRRTEGTQFRAGGGIGGSGYRSGYVSGTLRSDVVTWQAQAAAINDGPARDESYSRARTASLRLSAGDMHEASASAWVRLQRQTAASFPEDSGGPVYAVRRQLERRDTDAAVGEVNGEARTSWGSLRLYSNLLDHDSDTDSPGVAPGVRDPVGLPASASAATYRRWALGAVAVFGSGAEAPVLIGAQYEREHGENRSTLSFGPFTLPTSFELERRTRSVFAEGRWHVNERLALHSGLRGDDIAPYGLQTTYQLGARYRVGADLPTFALNYGTGFKPPSFFALAHPLVGNPRLRPEESRSVELSLASDPAAGIRALSYRAAVFQSRYENLVDFDAGPPPRLVNRSAVLIRGYEASVEKNLTDTLRLRAALTGLTFDLPAGTAPLRSRPRHRATSAVTYSVNPQLVAAVYGSWTSKVFDSSIPTGGRYLSPRLLVDATLAYESGGARFLLALDNVLNEAYQQFIGFPGAGRRLRLEVSVAM